MKPTKIYSIREGQWPTIEQLKALPRTRSYITEDCITYCTVCDKELVHYHKDIGDSQQILYVHPDCHIDIRVEMPGVEVKTS